MADAGSTPADETMIDLDKVYRKWLRDRVDILDTIYYVNTYHRPNGEPRKFGELRKQPYDGEVVKITNAVLV